MYIFKNIKLFFKNKLNIYFPILFNILRIYKYENHILSKEFTNHIKSLKKKDVVIDIGANIGIITEILAKRGLTVHSFEPNLLAFNKLKSLSKRYNNINCYNLAASSTNQRLKLFLHKDTDIKKRDLSQASSLLNNKPNVSQHLFDDIQAIDFAEFILSLNTKIELIKIDIEGYEIELINFLLDKKVLGNVKKIYVETHEKKFKDLIKPTNLLKERIKAEGYKNKFSFDWH
jgi:FkbM family methyltransferase